MSAFPSTVESWHAVARAVRTRIRERMGFGSARDPSATWQLKLGGFLIAAVGFGLTRFTVLNAVHRQESLVAFLLADGFAMILGLGIIVLGLGLSVSAVPHRVVNTVALWCLVGTGGMALIVGVVVLQAAIYGAVGPELDVWINSILTTALLGGAIGGLLSGYRSVTAHQHRDELALKIDQATLLNRIVRHEVLNKINVIQGNARAGVGETDDRADRFRTILRNADAIETAVEDIGFLLRTDRSEDLSLHPVSIGKLIDSELDEIASQYPTIDMRRPDPLPEARVPGDKHLRSVVHRVFEELVQRGGSEPSQLSVDVRTRPRSVDIEVRADGPSLSSTERAMLRRKSLPDHDAPSVGFGPAFLRLLVTQYGGDITVPESPPNDAVVLTVTFPRASDDQDTTAVRNVTGVELSELRDSGIAAVFAGVAMGLILQGTSDMIPAIGGLYGVQTLWAGWILHLFHSVVFGIAFSAVVTRPALRGLRTPIRCAAVGVGYGLLLWLVAAGLIMPVWLNLVGIASSIPNLTVPSLLGHLVWGAFLGGLYGAFPRLYSHQ